MEPNHSGVVGLKVEAAGDIHMELRDATGDRVGTVSAEIPVGPKWCEIRQTVFGWTAQKFPFNVDFEAKGFKRRLPAEMETALYRIVQEALTNIAKHAHAQHVGIVVEEDAHTVSATITDDGRGFDMSQIQKTPGSGQERGWGLVGMYERTHLLDGTLSIDSAPGTGTTIRSCIPLPTTFSPETKGPSELPIIGEAAELR